MRLLLGAQIVGGGDRRTPGRVRLEQCVDEGGVFAAGTLRGAHRVGVLPQESEVDHGQSA